MADGFDIQTWNTCINKAKYLELEIEINGDSFLLSRFGVFRTVQELFCFLCGYEWGVDRGKTECKGTKIK